MAEGGHLGFFRKFKIPSSVYPTFILHLKVVLYLFQVRKVLYIMYIGASMAIGGHLGFFRNFKIAQFSVSYFYIAF